MQSLILCCSDIINLSVAKIKGGWIKQHPVTKQLHFADFSVSRNEGLERKAWRELLGWLFSMYGRSVLPVVFLLQAFTITKLFDSNTEQSRNGLCSLRLPVIQWSNHSIFLILLWKIYLWNHWIKVT